MKQMARSLLASFETLCFFVRDASIRSSFLIKEIWNDRLIRFLLGPCLIELPFIWY